MTTNVQATTFNIGNSLIRRTFEVSAEGIFRTKSITNEVTGHEWLTGSGDEFKFVVYIKEFMLIFNGSNFQYLHHEIERTDGEQRLTVHLQLQLGEHGRLVPFAVGEVEPIAGNMPVTLHFVCYDDHPLIRKHMTIRNDFAYPVKLQSLAWEDLELNVDESATVIHDYLTKMSPSIVNNMDDCVMAIVRPEGNDGLLVATEAPGSLKRMEILSKPKRITLLYNNSEETIFEYALEPGENFESDCGFLLPFNGMWQDAVDGPYQRFIREKLAVCQAADVPTFTLNTWETFYNDISEDIVVENIRIAGELGFDAYQLDCGWYVDHGDYRPHPDKFPNGLEPVVEACRKAGLDLGLWMSVPNVHDDSPVFINHPEWHLLDENGENGFMMAWQKTHSMCLDSDYKYWILEQMDQTVKKYGVKLLKLDLASVRDPYNPMKSIGCYARNHHHRTYRSSYIGIYRTMFWLADELRRRNPKCLIDLTFELYGVLHGTDIAHIQHSHQNWIVNQDTPWIDVLRRMIGTRSRIVPSYTLNFGSCHLTDAVSQLYGFWSALTSHGLYYGDLRKMGQLQREHYRDLVTRVKAYRERHDFYSTYMLSDSLAIADTPDHQDRRFHPYSYYQAARVESQPQRWDGVARLSERGEGLVLLFRPATAESKTDVVRIPWANVDTSYVVRDFVRVQELGTYSGSELQAGITCTINENPGVLVLELEQK